ncbi:hypothetical protein [Limnohabitans sp.]|uniref:hypothetical protein n=1 Tax=Limnohabitans sp. TaxID=1907725 RepID=UPI0038B96595
MKKYFYFLIAFPIIAFAQAGKYDFTEDAGEYISNSDNVFYIIGAILILSMFGGWSVFKKVFTFFAYLFGLLGIAGGYAFILFKIGFYLQVILLGDTPKNNTFGIISFVFFIFGWFIPIWIYAKKTNEENEKDES